jgi:hypothetical protein
MFEQMLMVRVQFQPDLSVSFTTPCRPAARYF